MTSTLDIHTTVATELTPEQLGWVGGGNIISDMVWPIIHWLIDLANEIV